MTITISHGELSRLVSIVGPSVGKDALLPVFTWVHFRSHEGHIEVVTTDRYTMALARGTAEFPEGLSFNLALSDLRHLLAVARPARTAQVALALDVDIEAARVHVSTAQDTLAAGAEIRVSYKIPAGQYPDKAIRSASAKAASGTNAAAAAFNPEYLKRVPSFRGEPAVFLSTPGQASGFFGPDWAVLIMALKSADKALDWPSRWVTAEAKAEVAA